MSYKKCSVCGEWDFEDRHVCPAIFYFKHESWGDEFVEIRAHDFEDAAERFAELYNDEGNLVDSEETVVISDGKTEKKFIVSAELSVTYGAREV